PGQHAVTSPQLAPPIRRRLYFSDNLYALLFHAQRGDLFLALPLDPYNRGFKRMLTAPLLKYYLHARRDAHGIFRKHIYLDLEAVGIAYCKERFSRIDVTRTFVVDGEYASRHRGLQLVACRLICAGFSDP